MVTEGVDFIRKDRVITVSVVTTGKNIRSWPRIVLLLFMVGLVAVLGSINYYYHYYDGSVAFWSGDLKNLDLRGAACRASAIDDRHHKPEENQNVSHNRLSIGIGIFYHMSFMGAWERVVTQQFSNLQQVGLVAAAHTIQMTALGDMTSLDCQQLRVLLHKDLQRSPERILTGNKTLWEFPTLQIMYEYCHVHPQNVVLYLHSKGVNYGVKTETFVYSQQWRAAMEYFVVGRWQECVDHILRGGYDTCGINYNKKHPFPHYSGNFFWASCKFIQKLPGPMKVRKDALAMGQSVEDVRFLAERWLLQVAPPWSWFKSPKPFNCFSTGHYAGHYHGPFRLAALKGKNCSKHVVPEY